MLCKDPIQHIIWLLFCNIIGTPTSLGALFVLKRGRIVIKNCGTNEGIDVNEMIGKHLTRFEDLMDLIIPHFFPLDVVRCTMNLHLYDEHLKLTDSFLICFS